MAPSCSGVAIPVSGLMPVMALTTSSRPTASSLAARFCSSPENSALVIWPRPPRMVPCGCCRFACCRAAASFCRAISACSVIAPPPAGRRREGGDDAAGACWGRGRNGWSATAGRYESGGPLAAKQAGLNEGRGEGHASDPELRRCMIAAKAARRCSTCWGLTIEVGAACASAAGAAGATRLVW